MDQIIKNWDIICDQSRARKIGKFEIIKDGRDVRLIEHSDPIITWMGMTDRELIHYRRFCHLAKGNVLIAGLGLGLDLLNIVDKDDVDCIVVVEKEFDVIELVHPHIPCRKISILCDDIFECLRHTNSIFDTIYFDIFPGGCEMNPIPTNRLRKLAQPRLAPDGHLLFWYNL